MIDDGARVTVARSGPGAGFGFVLSVLVVVGGWRVCWGCGTAPGVGGGLGF